VRAQPEIAAEPDEVGRQFPLERRQLGDAARLDELTESCFDAGADPPQLTRAPGAHQLRDRKRHAADRFGSATVGTRHVRVRLGELEQGRERVQAVGDLRIVHRWIRQTSTRRR
jgi:hypothetical protein